MVLPDSWPANHRDSYNVGFLLLPYSVRVNLFLFLSPSGCFSPSPSPSFFLLNLSSCLSHSIPFLCLRTCVCLINTLLSDMNVYHAFIESDNLLHVCYYYNWNVQLTQASGTFPVPQSDQILLWVCICSMSESASCTLPDSSFESNVKRWMFCNRNVLFRLLST